ESQLIITGIPDIMSESILTPVGLIGMVRCSTANLLLILLLKLLAHRMNQYLINTEVKIEPVPS
ncbi:MAG: hypothetical protein P8X90_14925, partial [Desulfobacterales bacterium]